MPVEAHVGQLKETKYPSAYFTPGRCALLDMHNRMATLSGVARRTILIAELRSEKHDQKLAIGRGPNLGIWGG